MQMRGYWLPTMRDNPADARTASHRLMLRAGLIRQLASGVYALLPFGLRALHKIESIIREEMERAGAHETLLPSLHPSELWRQSGRWDEYGPELFRLRDRHESEFALGATHEEVVTALVRDDIKSYKRLPLLVYQIQTKFRDELRPRFGVMRAREFLMKDAYSFDATAQGLDDNYRRMRVAYEAIFRRCGLTVRVVEADSGTIGGTDTHEYIALSDVGEDTVVACPSCGYAANVEKAELAPEPIASRSGAHGEPTSVPPCRVVETPGVRTIEQLAAFLDVAPQSIVKTVAYRAGERIVVALVRGDYTINEIKLMRHLNVPHIELLPPDDVATELGSAAGYIGPVGLADSAAPRLVVLADYSVAGMTDAVCGANVPDRHLRHVQPDRDFQAVYADLRSATEGDGCPRCQAKLQLSKGIEVGHQFKLETKYSDKLQAVYTDERGRQQPMMMGCYGIGISRTLAAVIEQHHDEQGIVWPVAIAPFHVYVHPASMNDETQVRLAESLYRTLRSEGVEALYDDREESAGVKFKDAELLGIPLRVTAGRRAAERIVECKLRATRETIELDADQLPAFIHNRLLQEGFR